MCCRTGFGPKFSGLAPDDAKCSARWSKTRVNLATWMLLLGGFGCSGCCYARDSTQLWMEVLMRCFAGGPVTSATCIGVTRGHSRL